MLKDIRQPLLDEALKSPTLLSDLAGLEQYVAESYDARSFVDGREFTREDFESLCRSAASSKHRGASIGFRGIGFKSVVGFAKAIHLFSGGLEATFSREMTAREIPQATRVPLVRIPHPVEPTLRSRLADTLNRFKGAGFRTVFVFEDLVAVGIEAEFATFDATSLLFLRHVRQVELKAAGETVITVRRQEVEPLKHTVRLASSEGVTNWTVIERDSVALAFVHDETGIARLEERQAVVHAFLPTLEASGFPFKVNGDISTDPSRTRIILDERTAAGIGSVAKLIADLICDCVGGSSSRSQAGLIAALAPVSDPRMATFQRRGFKTELYAAIKREAGTRFDTYLCRPQWLNAADFAALAEASGAKFVQRNLEGVDGLAGFLKFLGARETTIRDLSAGLTNVAPSVAGAAEIAAHLTNLYATRQIETREINPEWKLWPVGDAPLSLHEAGRQHKALAESFTDLIVEKTGGTSEFPRMLQTLTDQAAFRTLLPGTPAAGEQPRQSGAATTVPTQQISLKRWRAAEQQALEILQVWGWEVKDVSRQNLGYDIEGRTREGEEAFVEVKSLDYPGQSFTLTSNEEAVARQKGTAYRLALIRQTNTHLEMALIRDPANQLKLTRQCRQWVWECAGYDYAPERFLLQ